MRVDAGGEAGEKVQGRDGAHAPPERGQHQQLHPPDGRRVEVEAAGVELRQRRRLALLHLGGHGHARNGQQLRRPRHRLPIDASPEEEAIEVGDGEVRRPVAEAEAPAGLKNPLDGGEASLAEPLL
uniref:Uncharacterized protein n=1 Tax=Zea mays TaxID=4577 RepID=C4J7R0_MAIZE|nr:unknown [Zea mays]